MSILQIPIHPSAPNSTITPVPHSTLPFPAPEEEGVAEGVEGASLTAVDDASTAGASVVVGAIVIVARGVELVGEGAGAEMILLR